MDMDKAKKNLGDQASEVAAGAQPVKSKAGSMSILLKGVCGNLMALGVNLLIGLLLTPFIIASVGKDDYGLYKLAACFMGYYGLLEMGIRGAVDRHVAYNLGKKDLLGVNQVVSTAIVYYGLVGVVVLLLLYFLSTKIAVFLAIPLESLQTFQYLLSFVGLSFLVTIFGAVFTSVILGHERFLDISTVQISRGIVRAVLSVLALSHGMGIIAVGAISLLEMSLASIVWCVLSYRYTPGLSVRLRYANWQTMRALLTFGLASILLMASDILRSQLDYVVITKWMTLDAVAVYSIAILLQGYIVITMQAATNFLLPRFCRLASSAESTSDINTLLTRGLLYSSMLTCFLACGLLFGGRAFIGVWVGEGFASVYEVLFVLVAGCIFAQAQMPAIHLLRARNQHYLAGFLQLVEGLINVTLSILLVGSMGIVGVAWGTAIPMTILMMTVYPVIISRVSGISLARYYRIIGLPILLFLPFLAGCGLYALPFDVHNLLSKYGFPPTRLVNLIFVVGSSFFFACLYLLACYAFVLPATEKQWLVQRLQVLFRMVGVGRKDA